MTTGTIKRKEICQDCKFFLDKSFGWGTCYLFKIDMLRSQSPDADHSWQKAKTCEYYNPLSPKLKSRYDPIDEGKAKWKDPKFIKKMEKESKKSVLPVSKTKIEYEYDKETNVKRIKTSPDVAKVSKRLKKRRQKQLAIDAGTIRINETKPKPSKKKVKKRLKSYKKPDSSSPVDHVVDAESRVKTKRKHKKQVLPKKRTKRKINSGVSSSAKSKVHLEGMKKDKVKLNIRERAVSEDQSIKEVTRIIKKPKKKVKKKKSVMVSAVKIQQDRSMKPKSNVKEATLKEKEVDPDVEKSDTMKPKKRKIRRKHPFERISEVIQKIISKLDAS